LAWLRTGITVIGLGSVVARFGLFLRVMRNPASNATEWTIIGVGLVLLGSIAIAAATYRQMRYYHVLSPELLPKLYSVRWTVWFAGLRAAMGIILAVHLLMHANGSD
jgi:putative membrane protein